MKYDVISTNLATLTAECLIIGVFEGEKLSPSAKKIDEISQGYISDFLKCGDFSANIEQTQFLYNVPNVTAKRILLVGCGKENNLSVRQYKKLNEAVFAALKRNKINACVSFLTEIAFDDRDLYWNIRFAVETMASQNYAFDQFKQQKFTPLTTAFQFNVAEKDIESARIAVQQASAVAFGVFSTRNLANMPPNICTPAYLSQQANELAQRSALIQTTIIDEKQMATLGMNAYLAVSQGAKNEAFLSIMEYKNHPDPNAKPIVLVGKGLTFDAGGISLKPAAEMDEMKYDMCGAATVFGVMNALVEMQLPLNVIGIMAGCENLPDGNAYRPGDILTTMKGSTVEVLNTDAEGRLVLCDTLTYVERFDPALVIDIATLTGACVVALGQHNSGLMSDDEQLVKQLEQAAQQAHDKVWRLPLGEEYEEQLKSNFADLANIGGRWGGASTAGAFLSHFTQNYPWAHLDIAGTAWLQGANKGATGRAVYLLSQFLINQVK